ncbi:hypothetical protein LTR84_001993 [Exophiala bonariae]|uniref:F-box domain-containing protein n=1 Tax=Exophiala bonariae TaxID=1690606 RepID=A0AAV9NC43_9EURO|nr:hypothetical protein LTR84_001993 [Exophiala bonariae]
MASSSAGQSSKELKASASTPCIPIDVPSELLSIVVSNLEPVDIVCLALTCHRSKEAIQKITQKPLKEICPRKEVTKVYFRQAQKHCLNGSLTDSFHVSAEYEDVMARLRLWFGFRKLYCYACQRYRNIGTCRCEMRDLARQDCLYWYRFYERNKTNS